MRFLLRHLIALVGLTIFVIVFCAGQIGASTIFDSVQLFDTSIETDASPQMITFSSPMAPQVPDHVVDTMSVWIKVLVGRRGWVKDVELLTSSNIEIIDEWAIEAAYGNKFVPITVDTHTVEIWVVYRLEFSISNAAIRGMMPLDFSTGVKLPKKLQSVKNRNIAIPTKLPQASFPPQALDMPFYMGVKVVWVKVYVEADGIPKKVEIVQPDDSDVGFEEAAIEATMKSEFVPWKRRGKPKSHWLYHSVIFVVPEIRSPNGLDLFDVQFPDSNGNFTD